MSDLRAHVALITGASSGIGRAIARRLASRGCDLILTARRAERLDALADELRAEHQVVARTIAMDLSEPGAASRLYEKARATGESIDILVNNAGFAVYKDFAATPWSRSHAMLGLNVSAPVELTYLFLGDALGRPRQAYILNIASTAAFMALPYMANYAATKAYMRSFSEALSLELQGSNVSVTCLSPGGTRTEFSDVAGQSLGKLARASLMTPDRCAEIGVRAMLRGRRSLVAGGMNKLMCLLTRLLPRSVFAASSVLILGRPLPPALEGREPEGIGKG